MDQYMALSKKDLVIHISLNELYNTHSLILQHIETLVSSRWKRRVPAADGYLCSHQTTSSISVF